MGLDITAYSHLEPCERDDDSVYVYANGFPGREAPLVQGQAYKSEDMPFRFRAGSYSGYNLWRDLLAKMAGYPLWEHNGEQCHAASCWYEGGHTSGPFYELINFSDCQGIIGSIAAKKLAQDFREWNERAKEFSSKTKTDPDYFYTLYQKWTRATELAAEGGAVCFR